MLINGIETPIERIATNSNKKSTTNKKQSTSMGAKLYFITLAGAVSLVSTSYVAYNYYNSDTTHKQIIDSIQSIDISGVNGLNNELSNTIYSWIIRIFYTSNSSVEPHIYTSQPKPTLLMKMFIEDDNKNTQLSETGMKELHDKLSFRYKPFDSLRYYENTQGPEDYRNISERNNEYLDNKLILDIYAANDIKINDYTNSTDTNENTIDKINHSIKTVDDLLFQIQSKIIGKSFKTLDLTESRSELDHQYQMEQINRNIVDLKCAQHILSIQKDADRMYNSWAKLIIDNVYTVDTNNNKTIQNQNNKNKYNILMKSIKESIINYKP